MTSAKWTRREALKSAAALAASVAPLSVRSQPAYPTKPVRVIISYPPGGSADTTARLLFGKLSDLLGQQFVIENRGGGGGTIGPAAVARAPADGYTLLFSATDFAVNPALRSDLQYDTFKDFQPVFLSARIPNMLVVHPSVKAETVSDIIAIAKATPEGISWASAGPGTLQHILLVMFAQLANVKVVHVAYKGGGPAMADLLGGHVKYYFGTVALCGPYVNKGALRGIGHSTTGRLPAFPNLPAISETLPGFYGVDWSGVWVRSGTPPEYIKILNDGLNKTLEDPAVKERLNALGIEASRNTPAEFGAFFDAEVQRMKKIVQQANIKLD